MTMISGTLTTTFNLGVQDVLPPVLVAPIPPQESAFPPELNLNWGLLKFFLQPPAPKPPVDPKLMLLDGETSYIA